MPLAGSIHSALSGDEAPYFESLAALDTWLDKPKPKLEGVLPFPSKNSTSSSSSATNEETGRLLVCHDYKGGYTESPTAMGYTFNFWSYCHTFIYFAHHRVTIPPSGWTTAAHRQGVKMLGTLIFEGSTEEDCLRLLVGHLPTTKTGSAAPSSDHSLPLSPHYARALAHLAYQRGFDGYLLNFECPLRGGVEQTRVLAAWISLLRQELHSRVGEHAEVIWYDSVIMTGQLRWQDRLNSVNVPFFVPSTGFFTNYTWPNHYPNITAQYFLDFPFPPALPRPITNSTVTIKSKTLQDIYIGIDVWGRGSHGGGGFGAFRALEHIDPQGLGLSVALFGPAWTWESEQDKKDFSWAHWWAYERRLWFGPAKGGENGETVVIPPMPEGHGDGRRPYEPLCTHGKFRPLVEFFSTTPTSSHQPTAGPSPRPASDPVHIPFCTTFSPGVGRGWFVCGKEVMHKEDGWTDVDKQTTLGDLLWPRPSINWEGGERELRLPRTAAEVVMHDAWLGGSAVRVSIADDGHGAGTQTNPYQVEEADAEDATFRCVSIPIQSVDVTPGRAYSAVLVFKLGNVEGMDVDVGLSARVTPIASGQGGGDEKSQWEVDVMPMANEEVDNGWTMLRIQVLLKSSAQDLTATSTSSISVDLGIIVGIAMEDPSQPLSTAVTLGLLTMHPSPEPAAAAYYPKLIWAAFESLSSPKVVESSTSADTTTSIVASTTSSSKFPGLLTWETGVAFASPASIPITSPEDPILAWTLADEPGWFPRFSYFNVYAIAISSASATGADNTEANTGNAATSLTSLTPSPEEAHFVGTTGLDGRTNRLVIEESMLPLPTGQDGQDGQGSVGGDGGNGWRWYVQGVTDHGEVVPWERCVFADHVI